MLATVAVLVILLGVMVSLARHVRERSAQALTKGLLKQLDAAMGEYGRRDEGRLPGVAAFPPAAAVAAATGTTGQMPLDPPFADRKLLLEAASANNRDLVRAFKAGSGPVGPTAGGSSPGEALLTQLPASVYDGTNLRDAWGSPIVFMPTKHPWVGTAPREKPSFFFSAGPDRDYLTRDDNLYSYEESPAAGQ